MNKFTFSQVSRKGKKRPAPLPSILSFIWLPPAIIGCVTFIVTLIKKRRSKKRRR